MSHISRFISHRYFTYAAVPLAAVIGFLIYGIYIWTHTQSTDNAYIEADISNVSAEISGIICEISAKENTYVKSGQVIAKIKDDDYQAQYKKAVAALEGAKRDIEVIEQKIKLAEIDKVKSRDNCEFAESSLKNAQADYDRTQKLSKENYASQQKLDDSRIAQEKAENELSQARLNAQTSEESLSLLEVQRLSAMAKYDTVYQEVALAQRDLDNTLIRSPIDGILGNSSLDLGNYVRVGVILFVVVPETLHVTANFKEIQIAKFMPGMEALLNFDAYPNYEVKGHIRNIAPATGSKFSLLPPSNATGNFTKIVQRVPVVIDFEIPQELQGKLRPGMSTTVSIRTNQQPKK